MLLANRGFNNLFDDMFKDPFFTRPYDNSSSQIMKTDIHDKDGSYIIEMELPGYAKEDIKTAILQSPPIRANPRKKRMPKETASTRNAIPELATEVFM